MKLIFNMIGGPTWVGGQLYVQNLVKCVQAAQHGDHAQIQIELLVPRDGAAKHTAGGSISVKTNGKRWQITRMMYAALGAVLPQGQWRHVWGRSSAFLYPSIDGRLLPCAAGGWIPDFQHIHMPELFGAEEIRNRNNAFARMANKLPLVFVSSDMAQQDFVRLYPHAAEKVRTLKFASVIDPTVLSGNHGEVLARYGLPKHFFLVCNQFWKHKDHAVVVAALKLLKAQGITPTVACTGAMHDYRNPDYPAQILSAIQAADLDAQVKILGFIPRADQLQLMRSCMAVIQPSRFEGWSTVVEDARTLGKPVVLSDFPVHLEQAPPGAIYFPVGDAIALSERLKTASENLKPGPDVAQESSAFEATQTHMRAIGKEFVNAVSHVVATSSRSAAVPST